MAPKIIVVMGVSASGKSTVGLHLAAIINAPFIDGDDLHPSVNIQKMIQGMPLDDEDRKPWLTAVRDIIHAWEINHESGVIACSALKKSYRDHIRTSNKSIQFLFLDGSYELIMSRIQARSGHFMKDIMLRSQFDILARPTNEPDVITVSIDGSFDDVMARSLAALSIGK